MRGTIPMIIAIDGPAGAGKSTTARGVAQHLGFAYIDTGAMYRAVALAAFESDLQTGRDEERIVHMARALPLSLSECGSRIFIGERDVSDLIRTAQIGALTSSLSALPALRDIIVAQQRRLAIEGVERCGGAVLEGRDIQTVVFPDAQIKVFLSADPHTRAARRLDQWAHSDQSERNQSQLNDQSQLNEAKVDAARLNEAQRDISERDERDSTRLVSPLKAAPDAIHIETDSLSPDQVIERIAQIANAQIANAQIANAQIANAQIALERSDSAILKQRGDFYERHDKGRLA